MNKLVAALAPLLLALGVSGCLEDAPTLSVDVGVSSIEGTFLDGSRTVAFRSRSDDQARAALQLDISGVAIDVELDLVSKLFTEDGHGGSLYAEDVASLIALRDELGARHPELTTSLQGALLLREIDRMAEVPLGLVLERHVADFSSSGLMASAGTGCGDDGVTCFSGTSGSTWAVHDPGANGTCVWKETRYGGGNCAGRCGAGCNFFDNDYTWDCLDHDRCIDAYGGDVLSGNVNCGDEFWDAADDYVATLAPFCFSGRSRSGPPAPALLSITVDPVLSMDLQQRVQLQAIGTYSDGATRDVTTTASWSSSNGSIATVASGRVQTAALPGTATITVAVGAVTRSVQIMVTTNVCHVTVNELQAGGTTAADEWVELFNGCTNAFDVSGWTLVYRAASAVGARDSAVLSALSGSIEPGGFRLYASASATPAIVTASTAVWSNNGLNGQLQASAGGIGLRSGPVTTGALVDAVSYGSLVAGHPFAEGGTSGPGLLNGHSVFRTPRDGHDSNRNAADLVASQASPPTPKAPNAKQP